MKRNSMPMLVATLLVLTACSDSSDNADDKQAVEPPSQSAAPSPHTSAPAAPPLNPEQQAAVDAAKKMGTQGTVLEILHASGYSYMKVDLGDGKTVWIAATMMRVKPQQKIQWVEGAVMTDFTSSSLHRTFDEILFVSSASVIQ